MNNFTFSGTVIYALLKFPPQVDLNEDASDFALLREGKCNGISLYIEEWKALVSVDNRNKINEFIAGSEFVFNIYDLCCVFLALYTCEYYSRSDLYRI